MESRSPKHSVEELVALKWACGALMGLVCVSTVFTISGHSPIPGVIACVVVALGLVAPRLVARIPEVVWKVYAIAIIPLVIWSISGGETIKALLDLNTWLILFRALNHTKRREEMQLVLLCLFLVLMTGILTTSMFFGVQLLLFTGIAIAYLMLGGSIECKLDGDLSGVAGMRRNSSIGFFRSVRSFLTLRVALMGLFLFAGLIGVASLFFAVIPRIDIDEKVSLFKIENKRTLSGFSDEVRLGEVTNIANDNSIALRVDVSEHSEIPEVPYWRMLALDKYENGSFRVSDELKEFHRGPLASPYHSIRYWPDKRFAESASGKSSNRWTFFLEPEISRYLPVLGPFEQLTIADLKNLSIGPRTHSFSLKELGSKVVSYQLENVDLSGRIPYVQERSLPAFPGQRHMHEETVEEGTYPHTLRELPEDQKIRAFLRGLVSSFSGEATTSAEGFARSATRYLAEQHDYSMQVRLEEAVSFEDPVLRWMNSDLPGHCEFFASSFVLLARSAGYEARVVVGFKGGEWNPYENYFMVRNADAHAWAEIYDGKEAWIRVDPTPGSATPGTAPRTHSVAEQRGIANSVALWDTLRILWYRRIVSFDETAQKEAVSQLKAFCLAYVEVAKSWAKEAKDYLYEWALGPWSVGRVLYLCVLLSLPLIAYVVERNLALSFRELLLVPFRRGDPIRRKAGKLIQWLSGVEPRNAELAKSVLLDLQRLRFGAKETWPNPRRVFRAARRVR